MQPMQGQVAPTTPQAEPGYVQTELCDCSGNYCKGCWGDFFGCTRPFVWYSLASRIKSKNTGIMFLIIALLYFVVSSIYMYKQVKNIYITLLPCLALPERNWNMVIC